MNRTVTVNISLRSVVMTLAVLLALYTASMIPDILIMLVVALILVAALTPVVEFFHRRMKWSRLLSTLATFGLIFGALGLIGLIVVPTAIDQAQTLIKELPGYTAKVRGTYAWIQEFDSRFHFLPDMNEVASTVSSFAAGWLTSTLGWAGKVVGGVATLFIVLITTFFLLLDGPALKKGFISLIPPAFRPMAEAQVDPIASKLGAYVQGVLVSIGFLTAYLGIALSLAGIPLAIVLALLAGIMEIIPLVGSLLGAIPAILIALTVSWQHALIVLGIFLLGNFIQGNFVAPFVFSKSVEVSPVMILFALLIGAEVMGIAGALIAVPVMAAIIVLIQNLYIEPMERAHEQQLTLASGATPIEGDEAVQFKPPTEG